MIVSALDAIQNGFRTTEASRVMRKNTSEIDKYARL